MSIAIATDTKTAAREFAETLVAEQAEQLKIIDAANGGLGLGAVFVKALRMTAETAFIRGAEHALKRVLARMNEGDSADREEGGDSAPDRGQKADPESKKGAPPI